MRLHVLSDLHLEFAPFEPPAVEADVVVLAGDTHVGLRGVEWAARAFGGRPVVYVLGNHEFYGHTAPDLIAKLRSRGAELGVHVLSDEVLTLGGVRVLGTTLWTDFRLFGPSPTAAITAQQRMVDFRKIRVSPRYRKLVPADTTLWHARSLRWLRQALAVPFEDPTVVVTHHAPSIRSVAPSLATDELSAAYASALEEVVASSGAAYWIHGHTHHNVRYELGTSCVLSNHGATPMSRWPASIPLWWSRCERHRTIRWCCHDLWPNQALNADAGPAMVSLDYLPSTHYSARVRRAVSAPRRLAGIVGP